MKPVSFIMSAALALFLPAAVAQQSLPPVNCTPPGCTVVITMSAGCGSGIKVAPDPVVVASRATVDITWSIQSPAWAFDGPGIVIHFPGDAFEGPKGADSKTVKARNVNRGSRSYKYDVNMKDADGRPCKLDPTIVNQ